MRATLSTSKEIEIRRGNTATEINRDESVIIVRNSEGAEFLRFRSMGMALKFIGSTLPVAFGAISANGTVNVFPAHRRNVNATEEYRNAYTVRMGF